MPTRLKSEQIIRMKSKFYAENRFHQSLAQFLHAVFVFLFVFLCAKILLWLYVQFSFYIALRCIAQRYCCEFWHKFSLWTIFTKDFKVCCCLRTIRFFVTANIDVVQFHQKTLPGIFDSVLLWIVSSLYLLHCDSKRVTLARFFALFLSLPDTMLHRHPTLERVERFSLSLESFPLL